MAEHLCTATEMTNEYLNESSKHIGKVTAPQQLMDNIQIAKETKQHISKQQRIVPISPRIKHKTVPCTFYCTTNYHCVDYETITHEEKLLTTIPIGSTSTTLFDKIGVRVQKNVYKLDSHE